MGQTTPVSGPLALTLDQVAAELQVTDRQVMKLIRTNTIGYMRVGGDIRIPRQCLEDYIEKLTVRPWSTAA